MIAPTASPGDAGRPAKSLVVCVDDDPSTLSSLRRLFRSEAYDVRTLESPREALALVETESVGLLISDHRMPEMSGTDLLEQVRLRSPNTARVLLTGYPSAPLGGDSPGGSADWLFSKPWSDDALRSTVRQLLAERRGEPASGDPAASLLGDILQRLGFLPPLLEPASRVPPVLRAFWEQMKAAYLDSPLPVLFREKLCAYLSRFSSSPYGLVVHACTLHGMGVRGRELLEFLQAAPPAVEIDLASDFSALWAVPGPLAAWPEPGTTLERSLFRCATALFRGGSAAVRCRAELRRVLGEESFARLLSLLSFIGLCQAWAEGHPEIRPDADARVEARLAGLLGEEPGLQEFISTHVDYVRREQNRVEDKLLDVIRGLRLREAELRRLQDELEARVRERTAELTRVNEALRDDIAARRRAEEERDRLSAQLLQGQKLQAIGQLAAGVAHEINNPVGYILSNLASQKEYHAELCRLVRAALALADAPGDEARALLERVRREVDLKDLTEDFASAIDESRAGAERIRDIVRSLKAFSHVDEGERRDADLHAVLEDSLRVCWNELKYKAEISRDYGELGLVSCYPQRIGQVFMNLLVNAAQAIRDRGEIRLSTRVEGAEAVVRIRDTGTGIPADVLPRIFEPFFTTKRVGEGTGLGLHVAYRIVQAHGGRIEVSSKVGEGTEFTVRLPLRPPSGPPTPGGS